jgi:hypothetical protein
MSYASSAFASSVWTRSSAWSAPHLLAATPASSRRISSLGGPATLASCVQRQERRGTSARVPDRDAPQHPPRRRTSRGAGLRILTARIRLVLQPRRRCWCDECAERVLAAELAGASAGSARAGALPEPRTMRRDGAGRAAVFPASRRSGGGASGRVEQGQVGSASIGSRHPAVGCGSVTLAARPRRDRSRAPCWLRASLLARSWRDASRGALPTAMARPGASRSSPPASRSSRSSSGGRARRRTCKAAPLAPARSPPR